MPEEKLIEIVTPAYNRADRLSNLYDSLCEQTDRGFRWIVVNDGSSDETEQLVHKWTREEKIEILYFYKENGGKHTALNLAFQKAELPLFFIVDSDDILPGDAVAAIRSCYEKYLPMIEKNHLCGFSFLRAFPDGSINCGEFPRNEEIDTYLNVRINGGIGGDKAEVFLTSVIKKYRFQTFSHERFMPEDALWMEMSGPYNMVHINKVIYISEYLENGLTRSGRKMKLHSPFGMMYRSSVYLNDRKVNLKTRVKMQLLYLIYDRFARKQRELKEIDMCQYQEQKKLCGINKGVLYYASVIPAFFIYKKWDRTYSSLIIPRWQSHLFR